MQLVDIENKIWHLLREPGPSTGQAAPTTGDFSKATVDADINIALGVFISSSGLAPSIAETTLSSTITAGLDYTLPAGLQSLIRVEYQLTGAGAKLLPEKTFAEFDELTGAGSATTQAGAPACYREPFNNIIRFWPQPNAANVTAGDKLILYYTTLGTSLVNATDIPGIPTQFHEALASWCLSRYWRRKLDYNQAELYRKDFLEHVKLAKEYYFDRNRAEQASMEDVEETETGANLFGGGY